MSAVRLGLWALIGVCGCACFPFHRECAQVATNASTEVVVESEAEFWRYLGRRVVAKGKALNEVKGVLGVLGEHFYIVLLPNLPEWSPDGPAKTPYVEWPRDIVGRVVTVAGRLEMRPPNPPDAKGYQQTWYVLEDWTFRGVEKRE